MEKSLQGSYMQIINSIYYFLTRKGSSLYSKRRFLKILKVCLQKLSKVQVLDPHPFYFIFMISGPANQIFEALFLLVLPPQSL